MPVNKEETVMSEAKHTACGGALQRALRKKGAVMNINKVIARAKRTGRIANGLVLCDNCDNPADRELSQRLGWTACAPCAWGEADSLDPAKFIAVASLAPSAAADARAKKGTK